MLQQVNAVEYGLTGAIFTRDLANAHRAAGRIQSENWDLKTAAKSPSGTLRMPSGALFSSSTPPCASSRAPRNDVVPQSTATSPGWPTRPCGS